ncbi:MULTISPECIES: hypothetical protein [Nostocales]|uniref:Uncharacterized protein n=3 Tax=Nostocales TaxID=1161 RepID=A0A0C1N602_9CYAN|nr:hypothetical protein [Tolypothrix bouteillei]KAF3885979.1 hypothetical protein DA73_0400011235 [Tolypothrix bouteillei VB521301]
MMDLPFLPPDDMPPVEVTLFDELLHRHLEQVSRNRFYELCDSTQQALLSLTQWYVETISGTMTLVILCHDMDSYPQIVETLPQFLERLKLLSNNSKICIQRPTDRGIVWRFEVEELSTEG